MSDHSNLRAALESSLVVHSEEGKRILESLWPIIERELERLEQEIERLNAEIQLFIDGRQWTDHTT